MPDTNFCYSHEHNVDILHELFKWKIANLKLQLQMAFTKLSYHYTFHPANISKAEETFNKTTAAIELELDELSRM